MKIDVIYGFLGSGKTTFIRNILQHWGNQERIVVLVNEFGDVGIDGDILQDQYGNIVEMPSGCICCTLQPEFRMQLWELCHNIQPDRVVIEPTGVAVISQVQHITHAEIFHDFITGINNVFIADASSFMTIYKSNRHFVETQITDADLALLNKCDLIGQTKAHVIKGGISAINSDISVLMTEYGAVNWGEYQAALKNTFKETNRESFRSPGSLTPELGNEWTSECSDASPNHEHHHLHFHPEEDALGYESLGRVFGEEYFHRSLLEELFQEMLGTSMGEEIVRAKGIFRVNSGSLLIELASGQIDRQPVKETSQSKISIIGKGLNSKIIDQRLNECIQSLE